MSDEIEVAEAMVRETSRRLATAEEHIKEARHRYDDAWDAYCRALRALADLLENR